MPLTGAGTCLVRLLCVCGGGVCVLLQNEELQSLRDRVRFLELELASVSAGAAASQALLKARTLTPNMSFDSVHLSPAAGSSPGDSRLSVSPHPTTGASPPAPTAGVAAVPPAARLPVSSAAEGRFGDGAHGGLLPAQVVAGVKQLDAFDDAGATPASPPSTASAVLQSLLSTLFLPISELSAVMAGGSGTARPAEFRRIHHTLRL